MPELTRVSAKEAPYPSVVVPAQVTLAASGEMAQASAAICIMLGRLDATLTALAKSVDAAVGLLQDVRFSGGPSSPPASLEPSISEPRPKRPL